MRIILHSWFPLEDLCQDLEVDNSLMLTRPFNYRWKKAHDNLEAVEPPRDVFFFFLSIIYSIPGFPLEDGHGNYLEVDLHISHTITHHTSYDIKIS